MKKFATIVLLFVALSVFAQQETGMQFVHGLTWQQVKEKAKAENKYIFMDAFTTWCGPCKMMAKNIFPLPEVGAFYNANYINLKVQLDTTANDNEEVKSWYADAHNIMKNFKVNVFPTYLFISPEGKLVHRAIGSSDAAAFIAKGKDALDPLKQYYTLSDRYDAGDRDPAFLKSLAEAALNAYDRDKVGVFSKAYLATQTNLATEENLKLLDAVTESSKDPGFEIIAKNSAAFDKVFGAGKAETKIRTIVMREEILPVIFASQNAKPDWTKLEQQLKAKFPQYAEEIMLNSKVLFYYNHQEWPVFSKYFSEYVKKYSKSVNANQLNQFAWAIFEQCSDMACVSQALEWSKKSVDLTSNHMFMDTYANLLYKTGKKDLAIQWEEKALKLAKEVKDDESSYVETLEKMKKGEKTW